MPADRWRSEHLCPVLHVAVGVACQKEFQNVSYNVKENASNKAYVIERQNAQLLFVLKSLSLIMLVCQDWKGRVVS